MNSNTASTLNFKPLKQKVSFRQRIKSESGWIILVFSGIGLIVLLIGLYRGIVLHEQASVVLIALGVIMIIQQISEYIKIADDLRLHNFARKNGMTYEPTKQYDKRPGIIFSEGHSKLFTSFLTAKTQAFSEFGNYQYNTGGGKSEQTHLYGIVSIKLDRRLPNIVLDSKKNNFLGKISNLPTGFSANQKVSLEGDFDSYFTLYVPAKYKTDALYVFTPDVMQALIESAHEYDCEIIDDTFYLYSSSEFDPTNIQQFEEILRIAGTLRKELTKQTSYYADERVGDRRLNIVGESGKQLKKKLSTLSIVACIAIILWGVFSISFVLSP